MQINNETKNGVSVFYVNGNIDISSSPDVKKYFDGAVKGTKGVVINLKEVDYIDSSGLATLVEVLKRVRANQSKLKLIGLSKKVKGLFEITKLDKLFDIADTEEEAINSLGN